MRVAIVLVGTLALALAAEDAGGAPPPPPPGQRWAPISALSDEFAGSTLDATKWVPKHIYWVGREPSAFAEDHVTVAGGTLRLRSTADLNLLAKAADPEKDVWVHAACISSLAPSATFGFYAARIRASRLSMTSSFWFQGKYSEIDVVEQIGASALMPEHGREMAANAHYFRDGWPTELASPGTWPMPREAADSFHVYGVWWQDARHLVFYHDGERVMEVAPKGDFDEPQYMFFDTEVFTGHGLPTVASLQDGTRNIMYVDWVRSWRLEAQPTP